MTTQNLSPKNNLLVHHFCLQLFIIMLSLSFFPSSPSSVCSSIESSLGRCAAYYMHSIFPNNVSYSQDEALQGYERYRVFAEFGCSVYADVYICLALAPLCNPPLPLPRPPCTSFCNNVTAQCNDAISARGGFGFDIYCLLECNRQVYNNVIQHMPLPTQLFSVPDKRALRLVHGMVCFATIRGCGLSAAVALLPVTIIIAS